MKSRLASVDRVEVAPDDHRLSVPSGARRGLRVSNHAVAADRLAEEVRVAFGVGGEVLELLGRDLRRVHPGDPFAFRELVDTSCPGAGACS